MQVGSGVSWAGSQEREETLHVSRGVTSLMVCGYDVTEDGDTKDSIGCLLRSISMTDVDHCQLWASHRAT